MLYESFIWTLAEFRAAKLIIIFEKLYIQSGDFCFLLTNHSPYATKLASIWNVKELYTTKNKIFILMKKIMVLAVAVLMCVGSMSAQRGGGLRE